ncbi:sulfite exporter TauE/SafE family protein [Oceanicola sp. D3]|uniref:TSUP family transporter n=1 Tax=Oceanicola sp. D3 TaxID=2587163 RepID=UPI0011208CEC|nr:TSUP family transporter [Oceanicola sp. D3]QDC09920.1 sulfite exporter TauE/SafE family protein [Oceanicola sp. D3]
MPEALAAALAVPGIVWVLAAAGAAGLAYGFAGFGAALIFMPVAAARVGPVEAVTLEACMGLASVVTVLPRALKLADTRDTGLLLVASLIGLPLGVWLLKVADPEVMRWGICAVAALTLCALVAGWRRKTSDTPRALIGVGAASGALGGATGLTGPVMILFKLSGQGSAVEVRASTISFLTLLSMLLLPMLWLQGLIRVEALWLALLVVPVYALGALCGQALFRPEMERLYRRVAYGLIGLAVAMSLPLW